MAQQMEFDQYITADGMTYDFHDARGGKFLISAAGQGMPGITYLEQRGPYQHGVTVTDYRLEPRVVTFVHERPSCDRAHYWDARSDLINYLRPNRSTPGSFGPGKLRKILANGTVRDIDAFIMSGPGYVARDAGTWRERTFREALRFYCPDPTFYDPTIVAVAASGQFCTGLVFAFTFPFVFCGKDQYVTDTLTYTGTWLTYPTIGIDGDVSRIVISNITTGEVLKLNHTVTSGNGVTFDLRYGSKRVHDAQGNNLMGSLSPDSDLATWHIAAAPEAPGGVNQIGITGYALTTPTVFFTYYTRYIGF